MEIKIAIASNINFYKQTLPIILQSLFSCDIKSSSICIFISGSENELKTFIDGIEYRFIKQNTFELSPLIDIVENELSSDYWFLIHDTCKVGLNFKTLLLDSIKITQPDKIALTNFPSMSIGLYKYSYLLSLKNELLKIKNLDNTIDGLLKLKYWAIENEDYVLHKLPPSAQIPKNEHTMKHITYENWFGSDTLRKTEYFGGFDIYKNKSNWGIAKPIIKM